MPKAHYIVELDSVFRGDVWPGANLTYNEEGVDFADVTARCDYRRGVDMDLLVSTTPPVTVTGLGQIQVAIALTGEQTALMPPGTVYGDVELYRESPPYGPKTRLHFQFDVIGDITSA